MQKFCLVSLFLLNIVAASAQQSRPAKSAEIYRELKTLKNIPKILYLAAHPDDENTGLLSWLVNDQHLQTAYLSLTRGDGGQNLLGKEQGAALGLIRTHELLEARKMDGAEQYFTRAIDFGFSKNTEDTFRQWDADSITADVVWVIRKFRPDVIICRFPPTAAAGHGQHAASAVVAEKAFKAAADPKMFPNQLKYVSVWQPKRLLWNIFRFNNETISGNQLSATIGNYDPQLGVGYGELAGISRSLHKSQGAGTPSTAGIRTEYFSPVAGQAAAKSIFEGIDKKWSNDIDASINQLIQSFSFNNPAASLPGLIALRKKIVQLKDANLRGDKLKALDQIILSAAGFMGEIVTSVPEAVAGESLNFRLNLIARSGVAVTVEEVNWGDDKQKTNRSLPNDSLITINKQITIPANAALTEPYWLAAPPKNAAQFSVASDTLIGLAEQEALLSVKLKLRIGTESLNINLPLSYKKLDPVKGDVIEPLRIIPKVNMRFNEPVYFAKKDQDLSVNFTLSSPKGLPEGRIIIRSGSDLLYDEPLRSGTAVNTASSQSTIQATIKKEALAKIPSGQFKIAVEFVTDNVHFYKDQVVIQYPHLPTLQYFIPATASVIKGDITVTAKKVGYIQGAGDLIPEFLRQAGIQVDALSEADILDKAKLAGYDAVVTGVRVINTEKRIKNWQQALRNYVNDGGTIVMQYNTTQDMALQDFGIYPFALSSLRVTEENAAVKFLNPAHRLLNYPNKITTADFDNWVQERGAYFPSGWDKNYEPLFEMNDTGETPLKGATLYAKYGKGNFIYTPLAFFRQLPAGNIGAARLFFNFISAGK